MAINPGAKKVIKLTPNTLGLSFPMANDNTIKNNNAVITGPIIVCPKTLRNLSVSLQYKA